MKRLLKVSQEIITRKEYLGVFVGVLMALVVWAMDAAPLSGLVAFVIMYVGVNIAGKYGH